MVHRPMSYCNLLPMAVALCGCSGAGSSDALVMSGVTNLGGASSAATGGSTSTGGLTSTGQSTSAGGVIGGGGTTAGASTAGATSSSVTFDWGTAAYDPSGGSSVSHQSHDNGMACLASCHSHTFQAGGTVYGTNGTTAAANVQLGIRANGALVTGYSGSGGNFFVSISGTVDWSTAQVAMRNANGTTVHPTTSGMSGNCNVSTCHGSSNRIIQP